jgi:hypothetical protein
MVRFNLKTLLICSAFVALWLSTFFPFPGASDIRAFLFTAILVTSGVATFSYTGRRRAFWGGFFGTMLALATRTAFNTFGASFTWSQRLAQELSRRISDTPVGLANLSNGIHLTFFLIEIVLMATLIGFASVYIYDRSRQQ